jgi:hypothetical protein
MLPSRALSRPLGNPRVRAALGLVPAVALVAIAGWEIASVAGQPSAAPTDADWRAAADHVRAGQRPGELVVFAPAWIDPLGRRWLGDRVPVEMAARMDADRYGVIWEVARDGARAAETAGLTPGATRRFGALEVRRYERPAAAVVTDFLVAARTLVPAVEVALEEVGFAAHRCVEVVPRPDQSELVVFRDVELGSRLVGYVGLADIFTRRDVRAPGRLAVAIDGDAVAEVEVGVDDGWVRFEAPTRPGRATVVFQATAVGAGARDRHICFAAEARR